MNWKGIRGRTGNYAPRNLERDLSRIMPMQEFPEIPNIFFLYTIAYLHLHVSHYEPREKNLTSHPSNDLDQSTNSQLYCNHRSISPEYISSKHSHDFMPNPQKVHQSPSRLGLAFT